MVDIGLDRRQVERILFTRQADGVAAGACAAGTADAVHVVFAVVRQIVVEDVRDGRDVQTARGDVGGDQNIEIAFGEVVEDAQAFFCATSPVSRPTR